MMNAAAVVANNNLPVVINSLHVAPAKTTTKTFQRRCSYDIVNDDLQTAMGICKSSFKYLSNLHLYPFQPPYFHHAHLQREEVKDVGLSAERPSS